MFDALRKCCLIDPDPNSKLFDCVYNRCGRTDKGVSALQNVCTLFVRYLPKGDYCSRLNHCLPPDIRILAYADVPPQFDSRFSCIFREYKYFFFAGSDEGIDVEKVRKAAKRYVGLHDFRNFCKRDEPNEKVDNFFRDEIACRDVEDEAQNYKRRIY